MVLYSVTIVIQADIEAEWVAWMKQIHVPDVLRTGCFSECRFHKVLATADEEVTYVLQYRCPSLEEYYRYRDNFAPALQKEHTDRFDGRFRGSRQILDQISVIKSTSP